MRGCWIAPNPFPERNGAVPTRVPELHDLALAGNHAGNNRLAALLDQAQRLDIVVHLKIAKSMQTERGQGAEGRKNIYIIYKPNKFIKIYHGSSVPKRNETKRDQSRACVAKIGVISAMDIGQNE